MMFLYPVITGLFLFCRTVIPLKIHWIYKAGLTLLLFLCAFKMQLVKLFGGPMFFAPDLPAPVLLGTAWLYAVELLFFLMLLLLEVPRDVFLLYAWRRKKKKWSENWHKAEPKIHLLLLLLSLLLASTGLASAMALPEVRQLDVFLPGLPAKADGCRIVLLADLHADRVNRADKMEAITDRVNERHPDLILIAGDFADGKTEKTGPELEPLRRLKAKYGIFGVPGNHEYYSGYVDWMAYLYKLGIRMLENEAVPLPDCGFTLAGITDPRASGKQNEIRPDLSAALRNVPRNLPVILLSHQPKTAQEASEHGVRLQLSGHTHGGMMPGLRQLVAVFNGGFTSGFYPVGNMLLYVSNGTCLWSGFPIRVLAPSEITEITLHPSKQEKVSWTITK